MLQVNDISDDLLKRLFSANMRPRIQLVRDESFPADFSPAELEELKAAATKKLAVVGIDVYRYADLPFQKQMFIPHLLEEIYDEAWFLVRQNFEYIFQHYGPAVGVSRDDFLKPEDFYINLGDGGFQILETPLHGVLFMVTHAMIMRLYNADRFLRKLHAKVGDLEVRWAMTLDDVYRYKGHLYGNGIINNARLLSRDRLNRFLIDPNVHKWFLDGIVGIENLMTVTLENISNLQDFAGYDPLKIQSGHNALIPKVKGLLVDDGFRTVSIQRVGKLKEKRTELDAFNVHMQALIHYRHEILGQDITFNLSLGNLHAHGIAASDEA